MKKRMQNPFEEKPKKEELPMQPGGYAPGAAPGGTPGRDIRRAPR